MREHSKVFTDKEKFRKANIAFNDYQKRHNIIRKDYEVLLAITDKYQNDIEKFDALYRASLKGFLSLIESDIFGLNQVDKFEGYSDKLSFEEKFKKTFKQICSTWNKDEIIQEYLDSKYGLLKSIKKKRDRLVHPKTSADIVNASKNEFLDLSRAFKDYYKMLHSIMDDFFISIDVQNVEDIIELFKKKIDTG